MARARRDNAAATLARLEHGSRPEEIAEAQAQVAEQRATLARARQDYDRPERLVGQGAVSRENFDQAKAALDESEARLAYAESALRLAEIGPRQEDIDAGRAQLAAEEAAIVQSERRLADSELIAPSDGHHPDAGPREGGDRRGRRDGLHAHLGFAGVGPHLCQRARPGPHRPGHAGRGPHRFGPRQIYKGKIGFISPTAEFTPKTVETRELRTDLVYRLRVVVDNPDGGLRQGMPVTVTLDLG